MSNTSQCPICANPDTQPVQLARNETSPAGPRTRSIRLCPACSHAWRLDNLTLDDVHQMQIAEFDQKFAAYPSDSPVKWWQFDRNALIAKQLEKLTSPGKLLDVGCGRGIFLNHLKPQWQRFGVEISPVAAEIARNHAHANVFTGALENCPFPDREFDVVTCFSVIEHTFDPAHFLQQCARLLRPDGLFVVMTGDRLSWRAKSDADNWPLYWPDEHIHFFSNASLTCALPQADLTPVKRQWRSLGRHTAAYNPIKARVVQCLERTPLISLPLGNILYLYARKH